MVNGDFVFPIYRDLRGNKLTGAVPHSLKEKSNNGQLQLRFGYHLQRLQLVSMLIKQSFNSFGSSLTSFLTYEVITVLFFHKLKLNVKEQRGVRR
jgi:transketolase N-terminal domain/subunit